MQPTRNAAATREKLLASARTRFLEESYESVSLRDVARGAGVDVALISRYFGSKEQLFRAVLHHGDKNWGTLNLSEPDLPDRLAEMLSDHSRDAEHAERFLIMMRSASSPQAAAIVRAAFQEDVLDPLAEVLGGTDGKARAAMALSVMMGTKVVRTFMNPDATDKPDPDILHKRLTAILRLALATGEAVLD